MPTKSSDSSPRANRQFQQALSLCQTGDLVGAKRLCRQILDSNPRHTDALHLLGLIAFQEQDHALAVTTLSKVVGIDPGYAAAFMNLGAAYRELRQYQAALDNCDKAIGLDARLCGAHYNRAVVLRHLGQLDAALASFDRALALRTDFAEARFGRSLLLLLRGDFERGWVDYEWRWQATLKGQMRHFTRPLWLGREDIAGKTVLVHGEQGLGDTLQFCRYTKLLAERGARILLEVRAPLVELLRSLPGVSRLIAAGAALPEFDYHCPLLSLPLALKTTLASIPAATPYLVADPAKVTQWRTRFGARARPRIGLCWSGNPHHINDLNRSVPLADLKGHLPADFDYVVVQTDLRASDRASLDVNPQIVNAARELRDFSDTAALCASLDLLISVDTSVAHLGGALAIRTWVLLPFDPDWRWLVERTDCPWYPTVRLYRQRCIGEWDHVLERVATDIGHMFGTPGRV